MVVGGGLAGLQAAWTGTEMGHDVTVFEKTDTLGGNFNYVGLHPFKQDAKNFYNYFMPKATTCGAKIVLNTEVTPELVTAEKPDAIIVAAGAEHVRPEIAGVDLPHVHFAYIADQGKAAVGDNVVIIGAGVVGLESALQLAREGKTVTVVDYQANSEIRDISAKAELPMLLSREQGTKIIYSTIVEEIQRDKVICRDRLSCKTFELPCDTVLLAAGLRPRREVYDALFHHDAISECDIFMVGDVKSPRQIGHAINEAFDIITHI
jgi:pyruvate/2-oxoglutarate dehydrogenase complex dihydrolipoamide dehydrogenase (E3) component